MFFCRLLIILDFGFLSDIFKQNLVLSCDSNDRSDIYLDVEPIIPLVVGEILLMKTVKCHFVFIHGGEWVLIFCLVQYGLLNKGHELEWIIARDCSITISIVLHLVHKYLGAMTYHH